MLSVTVSAFVAVSGSGPGMHCERFDFKTKNAKMKAESHQEMALLAKWLRHSRKATRGQPLVKNGRVAEVLPCGRE